MPRILGVDIPGRKQLRYSLRYIYGVGPARSDELIQKCNLDPVKKADDLTDEEVRALTQLLQGEYIVEGDLRREVNGNIRRLVSINSYRGRRHRMGLPCRGQRTSTNARTCKGPKKTIGAIRGKDARSAART
jgi:small subunit ribosomal protein S13